MKNEISDQQLRAYMSGKLKGEDRQAADKAMRSQYGRYWNQGTPENPKFPKSAVQRNTQNKFKNKNNQTVAEGVGLLTEGGENPDRYLQHLADPQRQKVASLVKERNATGGTSKNVIPVKGHVPEGSEFDVDFDSQGNVTPKGGGKTKPALRKERTGPILTETDPAFNRQQSTNPDWLKGSAEKPTQGAMSTELPPGRDAIESGWEDNRSARRRALSEERQKNRALNDMRDRSLRPVDEVMSESNRSRRRQMQTQERDKLQAGAYTATPTKDHALYPGIPEDYPIPDKMSPQLFEYMTKERGMSPKEAFKTAFGRQRDRALEESKLKDMTGFQKGAYKGLKPIDDALQFTTDELPRIVDEGLYDLWDSATSFGTKEERLAAEQRKKFSTLGELGAEGMMSELEREFGNSSGSATDQTIKTSGATTEEEAVDSLEATQSAEKPPAESLEAQEKIDAAKAQQRSTNKSAENGGQTASGDNVPNAEVKLTTEGASPERIQKAATVEQKVPRAMLTDPLWRQLNTMPPATEAEVGFFEAPAFQTAMLTFGLSMLSGRSVQEAFSTAGDAYFQSNYKTTSEYEQLIDNGVPESVIMSALETGKWEEVRAWNKEGAELKAKQAAALNPLRNLDETGRANLAHLRGRYDLMNKETVNFRSVGKLLTDYNKAIAEGKDFNHLDGIALINAFQRVVDPGATVKEGDVALIEEGITLDDKVISKIKKYDFRTAEGRAKVFKELNPRQIKELVAATSKSVSSQYQAARDEMRYLTGAATRMGIPEQYMDWQYSDMSQFMTEQEQDDQRYKGLFSNNNN